MAPSITYFSILIFLTLSSSLHVDARESKLFSKVTNYNNAKQVFPTKEHEEPLNIPEQEPNFIPENQQNSGGYGLYGHESGQLPPTTTTENLPYKTETENSYNKEFNPSSNNGQYYNNDAYVNPESYSNSNNGQQYYNNDGYVAKPQGMSDTRFMNKVYKPYTTPINKEDNFFNGGNMYNNRLHGIGETKLGVTNGYNKERQGMSDTRFMENGRYYYDLNRENNYNLNDNNVNENSRNEYYNNRGNYGNSYRGQYGNNENSFEAANSMEGYNGNQEEFQESQDEQFLP
ncbi:uncharacterized protein LOC141671818 [Apium graveolens]|uniref:uncharacterized protein LOC141671818 n=1 Tax=Apium graveolens TaxID=4045 RepID=UPI003D7A442F